VCVPCFESVLHGESFCNLTWVKNFKFTHTNAFESALHENSNTWADAGPLKVKYLVNAGNFKPIKILLIAVQSLKQGLLNDV